MRVNKSSLGLLSFAAAAANCAPASNLQAKQSQTPFSVIFCAGNLGNDIVEQYDFVSSGQCINFDSAMSRQLSNVFFLSSNADCILFEFPDEGIFDKFSSIYEESYQWIQKRKDNNNNNNNNKSGSSINAEANVTLPMPSAMNTVFDERMGVQGGGNVSASSRDEFAYGTASNQVVAVRCGSVDFPRFKRVWHSLSAVFATYATGACFKASSATTHVKIEALKIQRIYQLCTNLISIDMG
ncbi:hypothetical protein M422DRAFT_276658 [Sphaerobolus stellatus SS14]|uniref:Uncharacterized protein n=1 Tax=Sphaerobolus stellatus (strain SS14) TaxID=990650 RepID=A0A0C9T248_SPHS4|nr:hypothetical protein M422DRAFT_276658 [Sphaerobolus stellatus SS14]